MADLMLWRRLDLPGHEYCRLLPFEEGWKLTGTVVVVYKHNPCKLDYEVRCDSGWQTLSAKVNGWIGDRKIELDITVDSHRHWYLNGRECLSVEGCIDIDLGFSPSTNLFPIRRLALAEGERVDVKAAWLPFPSLSFELLPQSYTRQGNHTYRYESRNGQFTRILIVNDAGFVIDYPGIWKSEL